MGSNFQGEHGCVQAIPIIRVFDEVKAGEFYLDFLGMTLDWTHRFEADFPLYMQVSRDGLLLHLTEHSGDCSPGSKTLVTIDDLAGFYHEVTSRGYRYCRPEMKIAPWGDRVFEVVDPFSNKILFSEIASSS